MIQIFLPKSELIGPEQTPTRPQGAENRRHARHRFSQNLEIVRGDDEHEAMTFEISEGGLVRRKHGAMYGFEFLGLTEEQREKIRAKCKSLPPFQSLIDV